MSVDFSKLEVSNDELLRGVTSSALAAVEYMVKLDAVADQEEISQYSNSVINGLKGLKDGWDPNLYQNTLEALEDVKDASTNPDYSKTYQQGLIDLHEVGSLALARHKVLEDTLVAGENKLNILNENMSLLDRRTSDSLDIIEAVGRTEAMKIDSVAGTSAKQLTNRVTKIVDGLNYVNTLNQIDHDKIKEGLQVDLSKASAEYYQEVAEKAGFGRDRFQDEQTQDIIDLYLPEGKEVKFENYEEAIDILDDYKDHLGGISEGQLDVLAVENPRLMKAIVDISLGKRSPIDVEKDLGYGPDQADKIAELMNTHLTNIKTFGFGDKLSAWYKTAQETIETNITENVLPLQGDVIKAQLNGLNEDALFYLNEKIYGVPSGYSGGQSIETLRNLDDLSESILLNDDGRDELARLVNAAQKDVKSRATEINKDGIETLASDPIGFKFTQAVIDGDTAAMETSFQSYPSYFTEAKQLELQQVANTIRNNKDLLAKFHEVSGDMKTEALAIKSFQDRWRESGHILPSQQEIEMYQVSAKNAANAWDDELMTMLIPEDRRNNALVKLNMPTALKETLPEVVMRAANNVAYNANQLIGFEWIDNDYPQNQMMQRFKDNYDSIPDRMQALAAMADYFTQSDGKGGYMPSTTVDHLEDMTENDAEAKLFLDLMVAYRTLKALDPSLTKIK